MPVELLSSAAAVAAVRVVVAGLPARPLFIGVDGPGAAGKSTFAVTLANALPGAVVVHVDDLSGPQIDEWDWDRCRREVIEPLLRGAPARYLRWHWAADAGADWIELTPGSIVIIEGVSATRDELQAPWACRIWVETPRELRLQRALDRDGEAMRELWLQRWIPSEERYLAAQNPRARADVIVRGDG